MLRKGKFQLFWATVLGFALVNSVEIQQPTRYQGIQLNIGNEAYAKSRGGRSGGGSFSRSSPSRSSSGSSRSSGSSQRSTSPSRSYSSPSRPVDSTSSYQRNSPSAGSETRSRGNTGGRTGGGSFRRTSPPAESQQTRPYTPNRTNPPPNNGYYPNDGYYRNDSYYRQPGTTVIVPVPAAPAPNYPYNSYPHTQSQPTYPQTVPGGSNSAPAQASTTSDNSSDNDFLKFLVLMLFLGVAAAILWTIFFRLRRKNTAVSAAQEIDNDTVTITKLQVALLAEARSIQSDLTELSLSVDTETPEGLLQLLQESALALLRTPENWTHVLSSSQTVKSREEAEVTFNKLSFEERSKFSAETLTNMNGRMRQHDSVDSHSAEEPAAYIVVTLLIGTADDQPLFGEIRTDEALKEALQRAGSISPDYLMVFELLWSPQAETDTLTYDELLTEYTSMVQI